MRRLKQQAGFTLVELLLAMTLFSTAMVIATVGFIGINRSFTRGVVRKDLSEHAQSITEDLTRSLRSEGTQAAVKNCLETSPQPGSCPSGWSAICFNEVRYIWQTAGTGLYRDIPEACSDAPSSSKTTLLSERYRVQELKVTKLNLSTPEVLFNIKGILSTNQDTALQGSGDTLTCKGSAQAGANQTCAVEKFSFTVNARGKQ